MTNFIGRAKEIERLKAIQALKKAALVVIKGRRRIGKSRLVAEFAAGARFINITGMPPETGTKAQDQRDIFTHQLEELLNARVHRFQDWIAIFSHLTAKLTDKPTVILFDEISWMGSLDPTFIPKLKVWWDQDLQHRKNLILIFCGSVSTWVEDNIIKSTAFFGRISQIIELSPLSIQDSNTFLNQIGFKGSVIDRYKLLSVLGGIPWYLEQVSPQETADQNIHRLCFENKGLLTVEFDRIFHDLFTQKGAIYIEIMNALNEGMKTLAQIREIINYQRSGTLSTLMSHLITAGFVSQFPQWSIKTGKVRRQSLYRISDPYMRFYLRYIAPNLDNINRGRIPDMGHLPGYNAMMGFQVESLLLQNRDDIIRTIGIKPVDIVYDNPYVQKASALQKGCQIDFLIQTRTNTLYACEFKFRRQELKKDIIEEMLDKIQAINRPKGYSVVPVLFHVGGVAESVEESNFFYRIVDIGDWLQSHNIT
jgi:AAA+ ATPase superfamily predicted ATPase